MALNPAALELAAIPACLEIAQQIAIEAAGRAHDPDYADSIVAVATPTGAVVTTDYDKANLDEFGSINNSPTAAMRSAAADHGNFVPNPKP